MNKQYTDFGCFAQTWRHNIALHGEAFRFVTILLQLMINSGEKLFECGYRDPPYSDEEDETVSA